MTNIRHITLSALASGALIAGALVFAPAANASETSTAPGLTGTRSTVTPATLERALRNAQEAGRSATPSSLTASTIPDSTWAALEAAINPQSEVFDGAHALREGVSPTTVDDFATGWSAAGNATTNATVNVVEVAAIQQSATTPRACAGKNRSDHTGVQYNYYLNSCNTSKLLNAIHAGTGAAAIAGIIMAATGVGGAVAGIVAGALTVAGGIIGVCSSNGRGLVAHILQFTNVVWCNNQ